MIGKITEAFFNPATPCPKDIYMCEQLRAKYLEDIENKKSLGCRSCELTKIKAKYMQIIWERYTKDLIEKQRKEKQNILL